MSESIFTLIGRQTKALVNQKLDKSGGALTGELTLSADPTADLAAATKQYVDTEVAGVTVDLSDFYNKSAVDNLLADKANTTDLAGKADLSGATFTGDVNGTNLVLSGNLTVNGTTTTIDTANSTIKDSLIALSKGASGDPANDAGLVIERGSSDNAAMIWDESADSFTFVTTTSDSSVSQLADQTVADVAVAGINTNGDDLGTLGQFYGGIAVSSGAPTINKSEYDAEVANGVVSISGLSSPFASTTITTSYSNPSEIDIELSETSNDGSDTTVSVQTISLTKAALDDLTSSSGNITIGGTVVTFS